MLKFWRLFRVYEISIRDLQLRLTNYQTRFAIDFGVLACLYELSIGDFVDLYIYIFYILFNRLYFIMYDPIYYSIGYTL